MGEVDAVAVQWIYAGALFVMGLAIGSFVNVVAYRLPLEMSLLSPPSSCPSCGGRILARDNVPVLGWLLLRGRCRFCGEPISARYPIVELLTGVLWGIAGWQLAGLAHGHWTNVGIGLVRLAFVSAMVVTILVDMDYLIILDEISIGGAAVALIASPFLPPLHHAQSAAAYAAHNPILYRFFGGAAPWVRGFAASWTGLLVGLGFSLVLYYAGNILFRRQIAAAREEDPEIDSALGLGDVKLMACCGALLGWRSVFFVYGAGSLLGGVIGVALRLRSGDAEGEWGVAGLRRRWETGDSVVPFGPFLAAAALLYLFFGDRVMAAIMSLYRL